MAEPRPDWPVAALLAGSKSATVCVYAFDLLELQGRDVRDQPLEQPRARLKALLARNQGNVLRFSEAFPDVGLRSGPRSGWIKVKTERWRLENKYRGTLFEKA
jgi:hypothetical protein